MNIFEEINSEIIETLILVLIVISVLPIMIQLKADPSPIILLAFGVPSLFLLKLIFWIKEKLD